MDRTSFEVLGPTKGNSAADVIQPTTGKVFPLMLLTGFLGIFFLVNIRRMLIIDFRLPWPSSTATGATLKPHPFFTMDCYEHIWTMTVLARTYGPRPLLCLAPSPIPLQMMPWAGQPSLRPCSSKFQTAPSCLWPHFSYHGQCLPGQHAGGQLHVLFGGLCMA